MPVHEIVDVSGEHVEVAGIVFGLCRTRFMFT
jgi:hypothetical protein